MSEISLRASCPGDHVCKLSSYEADHNGDVMNQIVSSAGQNTMSASFLCGTGAFYFYVFTISNFLFYFTGLYISIPMIVILVVVILLVRYFYCKSK